MNKPGKGILVERFLPNYLNRNIHPIRNIQTGSPNTVWTHNLRNLSLPNLTNSKSSSRMSPCVITFPHKYRLLKTENTLKIELLNISCLF